MITWSELTRSGHPTSHDHISNLYQLHYKMNCVRHSFGFAMHVTSAYRTESDHARIYEAKNRERFRAGLDPVVIPRKSFHLFGAACDVLNENDLKRWILKNLSFIEHHDLFLEDFDATGGLDGGWVHFQIYPPGSGKRFFMP